MIKILTTVGNSKALIIPSELIKKYDLAKVEIVETDAGLLIKSAVQNDSFIKKMNKLRAQKNIIFERMKRQANHPKTKKYYADPANNFSEVDVDIIE